MSKTSKLLFTLAALATFGISATAQADENLDQFEGKIVKVVPSQREIYVFSDGQKNEYYFTTETTVSENGQTVAFNKLIEGEKVKVSAKKIGKRLDPVHVEILAE